MTTETARFVEGPSGPLFSVVTEGGAAERAAVICSGGWYMGSTNANRMLVRLARQITDQGYRTARFDWHGGGQSPGYVERYSLQEPFGADVVAVAETLQGRKTLVGICFGSRCALQAAHDIDDLEALALVSFPFPAGGTRAKRADQLRAKDAVRNAFRPEVLKGWFDPNSRRLYRKWLLLKYRAVKRKLFPKLAAPAKKVRDKVANQTMSIPQLVQELHALAQRGVRILFLFGDTDGHYDHFAAAAEEGPLGRLLERWGNQIEIRAISGDLSGFATTDSQESVLTHVTGWMSSSMTENT